ncbi:hypothetical protein ALC53_11367, partial [Atta colombica]
VLTATVFPDASHAAQSCIMYLPFVVTPFQMSLRARLCPIWLFPRAGRPQVAMTTPANLRDDFDRPEILAATFSLPESKNVDNKAFKTLFVLRQFMHIISDLIHQSFFERGILLLCEYFGNISDVWYFIQMQAVVI